MFLVKNSLYNPSFCFHSTRTDSYRLFVKLSSLVKSVSSCRIVFSFVLTFFFPRHIILSSNVPKKRNSVFVSTRP